MMMGLGFAVAALVAPAPVQDASALEWLSGSWVAQTEEGWTEEQWTDARGGTMFGVSRTGSGEGLKFFEYMRIEPGAERLEFVAQPKGAPPVGFPLVEIGDGFAAFENPANDYPVRIEYRRAGDRLTATISGPDGANPYSWSFCPRGVAC